MNHKIDKLIGLCTKRVPYYPAGNDGHPEYNIVFNKQKFAELLIKECAKIADDGFGSAHFGLGISGKMLKDHFGIKE